LNREWAAGFFTNILYEYSLRILFTNKAQESYMKKLYEFRAAVNEMLSHMEHVVDLSSESGLKGWREVRDEIVECAQEVDAGTVSEGNTLCALEEFVSWDWQEVDFDLIDSCEQNDEDDESSDEELHDSHDAEIDL
jgi:hypothetical protein